MEAIRGGLTQKRNETKCVKAHQVPVISDFIITAQSAEQGWSGTRKVVKVQCRLQSLCLKPSQIVSRRACVLLPSFYASSFSNRKEDSCPMREILPFTTTEASLRPKEDITLGLNMYSLDLIWPVYCARHNPATVRQRILYFVPPHSMCSHGFTFPMNADCLLETPPVVSHIF